MSRDPSSRIADAYPLSPVQHGLLFHSLFAPASGMYVTQVSCELRGLDPDAFCHAWQQAVDRHPILRTAFVWKKTEEPLQVVGRQVRLPIHTDDWSALDPAARAERLREFLAVDRRQGFEPSRAPLMRLALFRLDDGRHHLVWSHHHLLLDGWSVPLLLDEVMAFYRGALTGEAPRLREARPYGDYVTWLERQDRGAAERYWRDLLAGHEERAPPPLLGPADRADGAEPGVTEELALRLPEAETDEVTGLARGARVTLNTVIRGAWALYLGLTTGQRDVVFGATVSGRPETLDGAERMIGLFISTLPVRVGLPGERPLDGWLAELQIRQAEMESHGHLPLARIQRLGGHEPDNPLFETLLVFENYPQSPMDEPSPAESSGPAGGGGATVGMGGLRTFEATNYPLALLAAPGRRLTLRFQLDAARVSRLEARRALGHLRNLLLAMARQPAARFGTGCLLGPAERHQVLSEWNDVDDSAPLEPVLEGLVRQAARTPDRVAVESGERSLTYGELVRRVAGTAEALAEWGVGVGEVVAVLSPRDLELLVALLALFARRAVYLPLDPEHPPRKLAQVLSVSGARRVLVGEGCGEPLDQAFDGGASTARLDLASLAGLDADPEPALAGSVLDDTAYVLFTSGSTGVPKGAMITHRGMANHLRAKVDDLALGPDDAVAQTASQTFDISIWQFLAPLLVGGRVVVVPADEVLDGRRLLERSSRRRVTVLEVVPSLLRVLVETLAARRPGTPGATLDDLRFMIPTGEALPPALAQDWFARCPRVPLLNAYGPTECSDDVSHHLLERPPAAGASSVPIGRPVTGCRLVVVDRRLQPAPRGVAGELLVGGVGVGRGYLDAPARTAEVFVPDPFAAEPGARAYRTGDLVRALADGRLDFLGRLDHQVKIRGFRIELGEVEAVLGELPGVREVVVVARSHGAGHRLVAYLSAAPGRTLAVAELRRVAAERLPVYMVPAVFVELAELPLTDNGKIDRKALPEPGAAPDEDAATVAPRTPTEQTLWEIWREVLRLDRLGVTDDFFELGGDSILALQVVARAARRDFHLTPRLLFENPTVAGLAARAEEGTPRSLAEQGLVTGALPLTPIQARFFADDPRQPHHHNQSLLFELTALTDTLALERSVIALERHHDALRLRFEHDRRSGWRQTMAAPGPRAPFVTVALNALPAARRGPALTRAASRLQQGFDLARGPVFRVVLFDFGPEAPSRLWIVVHHLTMDGVSWRVLLEDLETAYLEASQSRRPHLPPKTTSFRTWAHRLRTWVEDDGWVDELKHWSDPVRDAVAPLPVDRFDGANSQSSALTVVASVDRERTETLLREVPMALGIRFEAVFLAALVEALHRWTGDDRFLVDLEGHGREALDDDVDVSRTVGWFTTLYPVLLEHAGDSPAARARAVGRQLEAVPRRGIGYGLLRHLHPDPAVRARLAAQPAADVSFDYLGQIDPAGDQRRWIRPGRESVGSDVDPDGRRSHLLLVSGQVSGDRLHLTVTASRNRHERSTVEALVAGVQGALEALVDQHRSGGLDDDRSPAVTGVEMSDDDLAALMTELDG